jgi:hypothetical protein
MAEMKPSGWYYVVECNDVRCKQPVHVMDDGANGTGSEMQLPHMLLNLTCTVCGQVAEYQAAAAHRVQIPPVQA